MAGKSSRRVRPERFVEDCISSLQLTDSQDRVLSDFGEDRGRPPVKPGKKKSGKSRGNRPT